MNKLHYFKFTEITLSGFRSYRDEKSISLDDTTLISGDNGKGKSSLAHAISYALYGVSAFGVQDINNILNEDSKTVTIKLKFIDNNGEMHDFMRSRTGDSTTLTMDGHKVTQKQVDGIFGEKNIFLSLFNPSYFIEVLGGKGKEMLQLKLPIVKKEQVLKKLSKNEALLLKDEDLTVPDGRLQSLRSENKKLNNQLISIEGQLDAFGSTARGNKEKKVALTSELSEIDAKIKALVDAQWDGINIEELKIERVFLEDKLKSDENTTAKNSLQELKNRLYEAENREYTPKYTEQMQEISAELKVHVKDFTDIKNFLGNLKVGNTCPTCFMKTTEENIGSLQNSMQIKLNEVCNLGKAAKEKRADLIELETKSKSAFVEFREQDIKNLTALIADAEQKLSTAAAEKEVYTRIAEIDELLRYGNLTEAEITELNCLRADKIGTEAQISALGDNSEDAYKTALAGKAETEEKINANNLLISAVKSYIEKRSQLALSALTMPNVKIQFHEFIKTTGELKDCYRFTYKGFDYSVLSLSEKIKAGLEVTAMLRKLYNLDYPVFIDNSESIGNLSSCELPSQTFIMRYVKDAELTVKTKSNAVPQTVAA